MQPSTKSDVYSFGVVLLELVTGKPAILRNPEPIPLINWARQRLAWGDIEGVVDTRMQGDHDINDVWKTTEIALKCIEQSPLERPSMTDVVMQLQECLDLEEGFERGDIGVYTDFDFCVDLIFNLSFIDFEFLQSFRSVTYGINIPIARKIVCECNE